MAGKKVVEIPSSKMKVAMTEILCDKGYILSYKIVEGKPAVLQGLDAERTEHKLVAPLGKALHAAFLLPPEFCFLRL